MRKAATTFITALLLTSTLWVFNAAPAHACSCEETTVASIDRSPGAIIGTIVSIDDIDDRWPEEDRFVATVDVLIDIKGTVPDQVFLDSYADDGGNCGTNWRTGQEIGVLLYEDETGALGGGGCGEFGRDLADKYAAPMSTGGLAEVVIVGDNGAYRTVAYNADGQAVAYGFESSGVSRVDLCDDGTTLVELVDNWSAEVQSIAVRSLSTFEIVRELPIESEAGMLFVTSVHCEAIDGSTVVLNAKEASEAQEIFGTYRVEASGVSLIDEPYVGEPFRPGGDGIWPAVRTSNGAIDGEGWMSYVIRLDEPVQVTPSRAAPTFAQIGSGLAPATARATPAPPRQAEEAPPAIEAPIPIDIRNVPIGQPQPSAAQTGGVSGTLVLAILGGLIVIGVIVAAALRADAKAD